MWKKKKKRVIFSNCDKTLIETVALRCLVIMSHSYAIAKQRVSTEKKKKIEKNKIKYKTKFND